MRARASLALALTTCALVLSIAACSGGEGTAAANRGGQGNGRGGADKPPLPVTAIQPDSGEVSHWYQTSGTLRALRVAQIRPRQSGVIDRMSVEEGAFVKEGDELAHLDARELALMATRDRLVASNQREQLESVASIQASGAVSAEEVRLLRYTAEQAKASAKLSRHQATLASVRAPFSGVITKRLVDIGNLAGTGTAMFELSDVSALELDLYLPEREAMAAQLDAPVKMTALDDSEIDGKIVRRAPVVDAGTGTVRVTVRVESPPATVAPGAFVRAAVLLARQDNVLRIPRSAIFDVEDKPHVWQIREGKVRRAALTLGLVGDTFAQVQGGLTAGDYFIEDAAGGLSEGMPVSAIDREGAVIESLAAPKKDGDEGGKGGGRGERGGGGSGSGGGGRRRPSG